MKQILKIIEKAQSDFQSQLSLSVETGGLSPERYQRFLSMQYHLTNGVQKHFFAIAANPEMANRKNLRKFLLNFGDEEESHYLIAKKDLDNSKLSLLPANLDVQLWWAFFDSVIAERPFVRLGATCILENISVGSNSIIQSLLQNAKHLNPRNTRFLVIHQHEELPHGAQIIEALTTAKLSASQLHDLEEGAQIGRTMYLRLFSWVLNGEEICGAKDSSTLRLVAA